MTDLQANQLQSLKQVAVIRDTMKFAILWCSIHLEETQTNH